MFMPGYTEKKALHDALKVLAFRVNTPAAPVVDELIDAESRLHDLTGAEVLAVMVAALNSGITPRVPPAVMVTTETAPSTVKNAGRFGRPILSLNLKK